MKFKKGDIIVCIDSGKFSDRITNNKEYVVSKYMERMDLVIVEMDDIGNKEVGWFDKRFRHKLPQILDESLFTL